MIRAQLLELDVTHPNPRKIKHAADILDSGGVIAYPTDTVYGIGCDLHNRKAIDRIYKIKGLAPGHRLSFICSDLATVSTYAYVTDFAYRWLKRMFPGPYTVILPANRTVPKVLLEKRREVGFRIPDNSTCLDLVRALGRPLISTSATDPQTGENLIDPEIIKQRLGHQLDLVIDTGLLTDEPSTVVSLVEDTIEILREGKGPIDLLERGHKF